MNNLVIKGTQSFMNKEIPVLSGGFGENKKCISDKTIAEIHKITESDVRKSINRNITRFKENIDFIDFKSTRHEMTSKSLLSNLGYSDVAIRNAKNIYILSERGYAKLIKIMDTDLAWEIHDKLIDEYFELRDEKQKPVCIEDVLIQSLQEMKSFREEQERQKNQIAQVEERVDSIREVVSLDTTSWRDDTSNIIRKISLSLGGGQAYSQVRSESYSYLEKRMGVNLKQRLTNKRRRMADEGICKSKRDRLSYIDIIADDKKLIEGYTAIVKEMAIKYNVA